LQKRMLSIFRGKWVAVTFPRIFEKVRHKAIKFSLRVLETSCFCGKKAGAKLGYKFENMSTYF